MSQLFAVGHDPKKTWAGMMGVKYSTKTMYNAISIGVISPHLIYSDLSGVHLTKETHFFSKRNAPEQRWSTLCKDHRGEVPMRSYDWLGDRFETLEDPKGVLICEQYQQNPGDMNHEILVYRDPHNGLF